MLSLLRHLLDASYLYAQNARPVAHWTLANVLVSLALSISALAAWRWRARLAESVWPALAPRVAVWLWLLALALHILHLQVAGALSARVWYLSAIAAALAAAPLHYGLRWRGLRRLRQLGRAMACQLAPNDPPMPWSWQLVCGLVHLGGLYALCVSEGLGWWPAALALACLIGAGWSRVQVCGWDRARWLAVEVLTPLILPYGTLLLRWLAIQVCGVDVSLYQAFPYPDPWSPWFDLRVTLLAGVAGTVITTGALLWRSRDAKRLPAQAVLGLMMLVLGLSWYIGTAARHVSRGVTGSDPYCYLQMAADLAERGTLLHEFPLASLASEAHLPLWPIVHVGYHPPLAGATGTLAPTVWPLGWPVLLSPFVLVGGERAALWAAPFWTVLTAILTWQAAQALWADSRDEKRWLAAGLAALITITSTEATLRSLVPMADAAAQALSILTLLCLVHAHRGDALHWSALAGASLALAYSVRHPQLFLGLAVLPFLLDGALPWSRRWRHLLLFGTAALVFATPDLVYRTVDFGSPLAFESSEWSLISWRNVGFTFLAMLRDGLLRRNEFGYLLALAVYGAYRQWRHKTYRPWAATMGLGFAGVLLFHLCYRALRLRDLISLFPWVGVWVGWGVADLWTHASGRTNAAGGRRIVAILVILLTLSARTVNTMAMSWNPRVWSFGYLTEAERAGYGRLAEALPANAVVGTGINSGAIERYTGRATVRPSSWSDQEFARFLRALSLQGRSLCLLDDGEEMAFFLRRVRETYTLRQVDRFDLPAFGLGGQPLECDGVLYTLE